MITRTWSVLPAATAASVSRSIPRTARPEKKKATEAASSGRSRYCCEG